MEERYNFPWFPFYPADWLSSGRVKIMTLQEKGAYMELLLYAWKSDACALPKHESILKSLASWPEPEFGEESPHNFQRVLDCFEPHPDRPNMLCNRRLYREWLKAIEQHRKLSQRGKKGAKKRWQTPSKSPSNGPVPPLRKAPKIQDRTTKGFEPVSAEVRTVTDKWLPPT